MRSMKRRIEDLEKRCDQLKLKYDQAKCIIFQFDERLKKLEECDTKS